MLLASKHRAPTAYTLEELNKGLFFLRRNGVLDAAQSMSKQLQSMPARAVVYWYTRTMSATGADPQLRGKKNEGVAARLLVLLGIGPVPEGWLREFGVEESARLWLLSWMALVETLDAGVWLLRGATFRDAVQQMQSSNAPKLVYAALMMRWGRLNAGMKDPTDDRVLQQRASTLLLLWLAHFYAERKNVAPLPSPAPGKEGFVSLRDI